MHPSLSRRGSGAMAPGPTSNVRTWSNLTTCFGKRASVGARFLQQETYRPTPTIGSVKTSRGFQVYWAGQPRIRNLVQNASLAGWPTRTSPPFLVPLRMPEASVAVTKARQIRSPQRRSYRSLAASIQENPPPADLYQSRDWHSMYLAFSNKLRPIVLSYSGGVPAQSMLIPDAGRNRQDEHWSSA